MGRIALQRRDVIYLKPTDPPAHDASVAVTLEHGPADDRPAAGIQVGVVSAQVVSCPAG